MPDPQPSATSDERAGGGEPVVLIEQVATLTGLTKRTLRYYEELGLLDPPTRTEGGYRVYSAADIQRLERIKRLRDLLGFSLKDIRTHVQAEEEREQVRTAYLQDTDPEARLKRLDDAEGLVRRQLSQVEAKLTGLVEMRDALLARLSRYDDLRAELRRQVAPPA